MNGDCWLVDEGDELSIFSLLVLADEAAAVVGALRGVALCSDDVSI